MLPTPSLCPVGWQIGSVSCLPNFLKELSLSLFFFPPLLKEYKYPLGFFSSLGRALGFLFWFFFFLFFSSMTLAFTGTLRAESVFKKKKKSYREKCQWEYKKKKNKGIYGFKWHSSTTSFFYFFFFFLPSPLIFFFFFFF